VINAIGNISSAANPLVVGWLKDATHSYAAGLIYSAALLAVGAAIVATLPVGRNGRSGLALRACPAAARGETR